MKNLFQHTFGNRIELHLYSLVHPVDTERLKIGNLPLGRTVLALYLGTFLSPPLTFKHSAHRNTPETCYSIGIPHLCQSRDSGLDKVVRVGRTL